MNILDILNTLIIGPIKLLLEVIFTLSYYLTNNAGVSIVILSLAVNVLLLPLYNRADKIQKEENEIEKKLKLGVDHIKKTFKGDERYMILQTYYRQNNYKQTDILKSLLPLLLEIPFFMAAYSFLSNLKVLNGYSFIYIQNLSLPDGLIRINNTSINVLPILMTLINIVSSLIYTKDASLKTKIQLFGMSFVFLILLYDSPSGLVFYWTLNNLFSLFKNIVNSNIKIKSSLSYTLSVIGILLIILVVFKPFETIKQEFFAIFILLFLQIPLIIKLLSKKKDNKEINIKNNSALFVLCMLLVSIIVGVVIPSSVIVTSPAEFVDSILLNNPLLYIFNTVLLSFGTFVIWFNIYYKMMNNKLKKIFELIGVFICIIAIIDFMFFGNNLGNISNLLEYDNGLEYSTVEYIINLIIVLLSLLTSILILKKYSNKIKSLIIIGIISFTIMSSLNIYKINTETKKAISLYQQNSQKNNNDIRFKLSKNEKNVVVIVLDRAINTYYSYMVNEKPELLKSFEGFTYYPNTISFGAYTIIASPAVYGGYEYTPMNINENKEKTVVEKQNEALKTLPVLFNNNNYDVTVFDPPYANYESIPDLSIYNGYSNIEAYNTMNGSFLIDGIDNTFNESALKRNLFCYSITRISPVILQSFLYNYGIYNSIDYYNDGYNNKAFIDSYAVLNNLINITEISDKSNGTLLLMKNDTTHSPVILQEPDYELSNNINNEEYDKQHLIRKDLEDNEITLKTSKQETHYHANMAAYIEIGKWLDYLKEKDVYDNTRIIITSDHGFDLNQYDELLLKDNEVNEDLMSYNPILLVKDFDSKEFKIDYSFMTNADVPYLSTKNLIENPINPFTGNAINNNDKYNENYVLFLHDENPSKDDFMLPNGQWYNVKNNIFDLDNWKKID